MHTINKIKEAGRLHVHFISFLGKSVWGRAQLYWLDIGSTAKINTVLPRISQCNQSLNSGPNAFKQDESRFDV